MQNFSSNVQRHCGRQWAKCFVHFVPVRCLLSQESQESHLHKTPLRRNPCCQLTMLKTCSVFIKLHIRFLYLKALKWQSSDANIKNILLERWSPISIVHHLTVVLCEIVTTWTSSYETTILLKIDFFEAVVQFLFFLLGELLLKTTSQGHTLDVHHGWNVELIYDGCFCVCNCMSVETQVFQLSVWAKQIYSVFFSHNVWIMAVNGICCTFNLI